ncbi:MAG: glutathione S-transferase family protein [Xanthomonadales bacterium]|nr:glutathione S-transferase family protein [Xanthomonadales bacterium]
MILFSNAFSPFARKVLLALHYKQLDFEEIDGLSERHRAALLEVNLRGEVPVLIDGDSIITQSALILSYLDDAYPQRPILPPQPDMRATARHLEYVFDTIVDAIVVDCSLWTWADRDDGPPAGLFELAQQDLDRVFVEVELRISAYDQTPGSFLLGASPTVADFALWPHLAALRPLGFSLDRSRFPCLAGWLEEVQENPLFRDDLARTRAFLSQPVMGTHERRKIAWRGDRIEWLLSRGFHRWLWDEIEEGRVIWPMQDSRARGN